MPVENLFSIPIYCDIIKNEDFKIVQSEIATAINLIDVSVLKNPWDDTVKTTFEFNSPNNFVENTPHFGNIIRDHTQEYFKEVNPRLPVVGINITESWINFSNKGDFQNYHSHTFSDLSGCYYYQSTVQDGDIKFKSTSSAHVSSSILLNKHVSHKPLQGKLLLFPSFLEHAVMINNTNNTRISISFNIKFIFK